MWSPTREKNPGRHAPLGVARRGRLEDGLVDQAHLLHDGVLERVVAEHLLQPAGLLAAAQRADGARPEIEIQAVVGGHFFRRLTRTSPRLRVSSREVFDTIPPGRVRDDRARPPRVRAVPARATGPAATGTETEAPASVFPGRARAPPPRSTLASRRGSQPHPGRGRPAVARHAMCRAFRSRATARARSARSLARRPARLDRVRVTRGSALRSAREGRRRALRSARAFAADYFGSNLRVEALGPQLFRARVGKNISLSAARAVWENFASETSHLFIDEK